MHIDANAVQQLRNNISVARIVAAACDYCGAAVPRNTVKHRLTCIVHKRFAAYIMLNCICVAKSHIFNR